MPCPPGTNLASYPKAKGPFQAHAAYDIYVYVSKISLYSKISRSLTHPRIRNLFPFQNFDFGTASRQSLRVTSFSGPARVISDGSLVYSMMISSVLSYLYSLLKFCS